MQFIPRIQKTDVVARRLFDSLVHRIIQPFVRFADDLVYMRPVLFDDFQCPVF